LTSIPLYSISCTPIQ